MLLSTSRGKACGANTLGAPFAFAIGGKRNQINKISEAHFSLCILLATRIKNEV